MSTNIFVKMLNKLQTDFSSRFLDFKLQKNLGVYLKIHLILMKIMSTLLFNFKLLS